tara:strand:+ start:422 stop:799 length:378 start_codon:yes stop_codon:yes gene_type:complete
MAHYAFITDKVVTEVIVGKDEGTDGVDWEEYYGNYRGQTCKRTSYNTYGNTHKDGGTPFRGNFAGIGFTYDVDNDVFYEPQPYSSWTLNSNWIWEAPLTYPDDGQVYIWDEEAYQADNSTGWVTP